MKRFLAMLLAMCLVFSGCGVQTDAPTGTGETTTVPGETLPPAVGFAWLDVHAFDALHPETDVATLGDNLVKDSDFAGEQLLWSLYTESGGTAAMGKENETLAVKITHSGSVSHGVQVFYDCSKMHKFAKYEFRFTASCTTEKVLEARIQLNGGDYHPYVIDYLTLTAEKQTFALPFTMESDTDPAPRIAFNMGCVAAKGESPMDDYTVTLDDISLVCVDDSQVTEVEEVPTVDILVNQLGYAPEGEKTVYFRGFKFVDEFDVIDEQGDVVYSGKTTQAEKYPAGWEFVWQGDFSQVTEPGVYRISAGVLGESYPFTIGENLYDGVFRDLVRMLYLQRCGCEIPGDSGHPACHGSLARIYGTEAFIDVSGGWHDAGDYGRYVVPGAKTVMDLLLAYEANPELFGDDWGIPESGNGVPDILDEARWELEWMLKMQDPVSGGVHHKVTTAEFCGTVMPQDDTAELIVTPVSDYATADFSAVMANAYRVYGSFDQEFAATCLEAAKTAWEFLEIIKEPLPKGNPAGITTGEYLDSRDFDEHCWAAVELYRITGEEKYRAAAEKATSFRVYTGLGWADIGGYGDNSYLAIPEADCDPVLREKFRTALLEAADSIVNRSKADAYGISVGESYPWGSNMTVANNAMLLLMANDLAPNADYVYYARRHLDYLFGVNPMATSYVTGWGTVSPQSPHHRPSQTLGKTMPGMLVGGPDSSLEDPYAKAVLADTAPAKCYVDNEASYSCNEVTIYWNSPLIYLLSRLENLG